MPLPLQGNNKTKVNFAHCHRCHRGVCMGPAYRVRPWTPGGICRRCIAPCPQPPTATSAAATWTPALAANCRVFGIPGLRAVSRSCGCTPTPAPQQGWAGLGSLNLFLRLCDTLQAAELWPPSLGRLCNATAEIHAKWDWPRWSLA